MLGGGYRFSSSTGGGSAKELIVSGPVGGGGEGATSCVPGPISVPGVR
jgi:hypothetical protein